MPYPFQIFQNEKAIVFMTFRDGTKLFMGSSGTGAPPDGKYPTEPQEEKKKPQR